MPRVAWKSFTEARALVRGLELKRQKEWKEWSKSNHRPSDIPANPHTTYRDDGWISWPDWLGNGKQYDMLPFAVGRAYVRKLKLKNQPEWREWSKSGQRPSDIPSSPHTTYRDDGWVSWPDWLGSEKVAWKSFTEGRALVRGLELKRQEEWKEWSKSNHRPSDIPANPHKVYRDDGWNSWPDWLGSEGRYNSMLPFAVGGAYARKLNLRNQKEWKEWSKSGQRPSNIPAAPERTYRDDGWVSLPDWLGYGSERGGAAASRSSSSSSSAATAPKKKKAKKKRKRHPTTSHPSDLPPPPPPSTSPSKPYVKTEGPSSKSSGGGSDHSIAPEPPLRKIKKEEDA
jgi:hypothetical protein